MGTESLLVFLFVGLISGWLAGKVVRGGGFGILGNIVVGVIGAFLAGWLLPQLGFVIGGSGILAAIINAFIGAVILLVILRLVKQA